MSKTTSSTPHTENGIPAPTAGRSPLHLIPQFLTVALLLGLGYLLYTNEWEMLYRAQELSLFLETKDFYDNMQIYPGGALQWLSCWATQFFFNPGVGVALLVAFWAFIIVRLWRIFHLRGWALLLAWIPILLLMTGIVQTGYWINYTKLQGYFFVPTLGILLSLMGTGIYRLLTGGQTQNPVRWTAGLVWMLAFAWWGYQGLGAWSFLGIALMGIPSSLDAFIDPEKRNGRNLAFTLLPLLLAGLCIGLVPRIAYSHVYCQTQIDTVYVASMPSFQYGEHTNHHMKMTYIWLLLSFLPMIVKRYVPEEARTWKPRLVYAAILAGLLAFSTHLLTSNWYHNEQFHRELSMIRLAEERDWEGILEEAPYWNEPDTLKAPTRSMIMFKNLALFRLGRAGDEMFDYMEGATEQHMDSLQIRMTQVGGKLLYYNYGKLNYCYRWCMEDGVEFGWKVEQLKLMAQCALLKGEWKVAEKYLNLLKQTRYHRKWAEEQEAFLYHPERMEKDPDLAPICQLKEFGDRLDGDNSLIELYLLRTFSNGHGINPVYQENTLLCSLIMKDIDLFWPRFQEYILMHQKEPGFRVPRHYQEAALLYSVLEPNRESILWPGHSQGELIQHLPVDTSVKDSYKKFMDFNSRPDISPLSEAQKRIEFRPQFGNTFYYFYFLVRGQRTN